LPMSHHALQSCFSQRLNQRSSSRATDDFFNTIGQFLPRPYSLGAAANHRGKAAAIEVVRQLMTPTGALTPVSASCSPS